VTSSKWRWPTIATSGSATLVLLVSLVVGGLGYQAPKSSPEPSPTPSPTASASSAPTTCAPEFKQVAGNNANNRIDADFDTKYAKATVNANNLSAAQKQLLIENSANNAQRLAIWSNAFGLYDDPNNWQPLVAGNCLSNEGQALFNQMKGALNAVGTTVKEDNAPKDGYNSGINNGTYGVDGSQGISGNRKAIKITLPDGTVVWILVRCGNVVHQAPPPNIPKVPTDQCPPGTVGTPGNCLASKDPSQDPAQNGNAGNGGGVNQDPGPGTYQPTKPADPPAAPRVNPAPPTVQKTPPPQVNTSPSPTPQPTVNPGTQPPNDGVIGDSGDPSNPDPVSTDAPCNPEFQNCP